MIFDQIGARNVFQLWVEKHFFLDRPSVKSVRMTRGGKFIVEIEDEQANKATKAASAKINSQKREEISSPTLPEDGTDGPGVEQAVVLNSSNPLSSDAKKSAIRN